MTAWAPVGAKKPMGEGSTWFSIVQCRVVTTGEADTDTSLMSHRTLGSRGTLPGQPGDRGNSLLMQYEPGVSRRAD